MVSLFVLICDQVNFSVLLCSFTAVVSEQTHAWLTARVRERSNPLARDPNLSLLSDYYSGESFYFSFAFLKGEYFSKETKIEFDRTLIFPLPLSCSDCAQYLFVVTHLSAANCAAFPAYTALFEVVVFAMCLGVKRSHRRFNFPAINIALRPNLLMWRLVHS